MATLNFPFRLGLEPQDLSRFAATKTIERRLSDMVEYFLDREATSERLRTENPIIYRFWEVENHDAPRGLSLGVTTIAPGTIGREYHMTKGHFHTGDGDEVYVTLRGQGKLLLFSREGDHQEFDMLPGSLCYIHTRYAHRTVNTGDEDFTFVAVWPPVIPHDYESVLRTGFPRLALKGVNGPEILPNPKFAQT
jgi:glucose-6-phosphate isomerase